MWAYSSQSKKIWFVGLYQKMIEIYRGIIKLRKSVYKKEIWRVKVGCNEKKLPTHTFLFFCWKQITKDASCTFFLHSTVNLLLIHI